MKPRHQVLSWLALGSAALLLTPALGSFGFSKTGDSLGLGFRDVRVFDNFADPQANNNTTPDPQFPGQTGAELAIWKAVVEWGSGLHGNGAGDPTQPSLGDGGANFDAAWMGKASGVGGTNDNIVSAISGCEGVTSFVELPSSDGWRIRLCDNGIIWSDGPGGPGINENDIQGVLTHEYGHALGLGHSSNSQATMSASFGSGQVSIRSIEPDDQDGVQCVYGVRSSTKPVISAVSVKGAQVFTVTITGSNFAASGNDVWFTPRKTTLPAADPRVRFKNLISSNGGTKITIPVSNANQINAGDCLVKIPGMGGDKLSNAFPFKFP